MIQYIYVIFLPIKEQGKILNTELFFQDQRISGYITSLVLIKHFLVRKFLKYCGNNFERTIFEETT